MLLLTSTLGSKQKGTRWCYPSRTTFLFYPEWKWPETSTWPWPSESVHGLQPKVESKGLMFVHFHRWSIKLGRNHSHSGYGWWSLFIIVVRSIIFSTISFGMLSPIFIIMQFVKVHSYSLEDDFNDKQAVFHFHDGVTSRLRTSTLDSYPLNHQSSQTKVDQAVHHCVLHHAWPTSKCKDW